MVSVTVVAGARLVSKGEIRVSYGYYGYRICVTGALVVDQKGILVVDQVGMLLLDQEGMLPSFSICMSSPFDLLSSSFRRPEYRKRRLSSDASYSKTNTAPVDVNNATNA